MNLSPQQQSVVDFVLHETSSLNVIARAGCGKTTTLLSVAHALLNANPAFLPRILYAAFNKSIADEVKVKAGKMGIGMDSSTMHSAGFALWRRMAPRVRVDEGKMRTITTELARRDEDLWEVVSQISQCVSLAKQTGIGFLHEIEDLDAWFHLVDHFGLDDLPERVGVKRLITAAQIALVRSIKLDAELIDFDDMIFAPLFHKVPNSTPYDFVLLDEAQDTNPARRALARLLLRPATGRLIAVGDDRQAIYGFSGADAQALELIKKEMGSSSLPLNVTYRCPKAITLEAQRYVPDITAHESAPEGAVWRGEKIEGRWMSNVGGAEPLAITFLPTDAILCRLTAPLIKMAYEFIRSQTPVKVEGRDIGKGLEKLAERWKVPNLSALISRLEEHREEETAKWLVKDREDKVQQVSDKVGSLIALCEICLAEGKDQPSDLKALIARMFGDSKAGDQQSLLTLSTIHKAKGREWPRVFILGFSTLMPSPYARKEWQKDQERNLAYVAITRAQETLVYLDL